MSIGSILVTTAIAIFATGVVAEARAQGQKDWRKEGPCSEEVKNFCARVEPGEARIADCMADNFRRLRPSCRGAITAARNKFDRMVDACKGDAEKFCKGIPYREGRVLSCLKGRQSDLGPACATQFKRAGSDPAIFQ